MATLSLSLPSSQVSASSISCSIADEMDSRRVRIGDKDEENLQLCVEEVQPQPPDPSDSTAKPSSGLEVIIVKPQEQEAKGEAQADPNIARVQDEPATSAPTLIPLQCSQTTESFTTNDSSAPVDLEKGREESEMSISTTGCAICLETPKDKQTFKCGHCFCTKCIARWVLLNPSCPTCRWRVPNSVIRDLITAAGPEVVGANPQLPVRSSRVSLFLIISLSSLATLIIGIIVWVGVHFGSS